MLKSAWRLIEVCLCQTDVQTEVVTPWALCQSLNQNNILDISISFSSRPGARLQAPPLNAKLTKDNDALAKLKEVLDPDDIEFLRKKLLNDRRRVPKSLNLNSDEGPRDLEFLLDDDRKPKTIPRTILPKEEIERLKQRAQESSSPSKLSRDNLGRLELLLKGYL